MNDTGAHTSGPLTYILGAIAAAISQMSANDWLVILSIVLVSLRIFVELSDYRHRRESRKKYKGGDDAN